MLQKILSMFKCVVRLCAPVSVGDVVVARLQGGYDWVCGVGAA